MPAPDDSSALTDDAVTVIFAGPVGDASLCATARAGERLLDVAQREGQPMEGTCEGQMACSTCHVIVDPDDFRLLPAASADEEDMLDFAPGAVRTSRLACQIILDPGVNPLRVRLPGSSR